MINMRRLRERAVLLPLAAFICLSPPLLLVFNSAELILGIPVLYIYTFSVWLLLILAGLFLARALQKAEQMEIDLQMQRKRDRSKNNIPIERSPPVERQLN